MKNISFFLTTAQFRQRTKTVTRRLGWKNVKPGEVLMGVVKGQGIPKGGSVERLGPIRVKSARREILNNMGPGECVLEGFPEMSPAEFIVMFCAHNGCTPETEVTRIEFEYIK